MKTLKYFLMAVVVGALLNVSCTHKFDEYNTDPNNMPYGKADPMSFLEDLIFKGADNLLYRTYQINGELIQYTVKTSVGNTFHRFYVTNGHVTSVWNELAADAANANEMLRLARLQNRPECEAVALTLRAMFMQELTDIFGDVPFSEAFQGYEGNTMPKFDTQEEIYRQLFLDLREANDLYSKCVSGKNSMSIPSKDLLYGGDLSKWQKFNNSLYLRMLMRVSGRNAALNVSTQLKEIYGNPGQWPVFASIDDSAIMKFTGIVPNVNRFGDVQLANFTTSGSRACQNMVDLMDPSRDPRYIIFFREIGGTRSGLISGRNIKEDDGDSSKADYLEKENLGNYTSWHSFMNYDEVLFIWAEAAQRGLIDGGATVAKQMYEQAVEQSVRHWIRQDVRNTHPTELAISDFVEKVAYDGTYEQLMVQKYLALFWVGWQGWNEYRRTGYPVLSILPSTLNNHIVPRRFFYPVNTRDTNLENYNKALERLQNTFQGDDDMLTPVWWSQEGIHRCR